MNMDAKIAALRKALKPLADEPLKDEMPTDNRLCDLGDNEMDAVILAAREAMAMTEEVAQSIH